MYWTTEEMVSAIDFKGEGFAPVAMGGEFGPVVMGVKAQWLWGSKPSGYGGKSIVVMG